MAFPQTQWRNFIGAGKNLLCIHFCSHFNFTALFTFEPRGNTQHLFAFIAVALMDAFYEVYWGKYTIKN